MPKACTGKQNIAITFTPAQRLHVLSLENERHQPRRISRVLTETDCSLYLRGVVNATNVSNWAALIYGDVRIDRRPLVIPVGREVKGGGKS